MKCIKPGILPEDEIWHGRCGYCDAEYEAKKSELKFIGAGIYQSGHAECELCKNNIVFIKKIK